MEQDLPEKIKYAIEIKSHIQRIRMLAARIERLSDEYGEKFAVLESLASNPPCPEKETSALKPGGISMLNPDERVISLSTYSAGGGTFFVIDGGMVKITHGDQPEVSVPLDSLLFFARASRRSHIVWVMPSPGRPKADGTDKHTSSES